MRRREAKKLTHTHTHTCYIHLSNQWLLDTYITGLENERVHYSFAFFFFVFHTCLLSVFKINFKDEVYYAMRPKPYRFSREGWIAMGRGGWTTTVGEWDGFTWSNDTVGRQASRYLYAAPVACAQVLHSIFVENSQTPLPPPICL